MARPQQAFASAHRFTCGFRWLFACLAVATCWCPISHAAESYSEIEAAYRAGDLTKAGEVSAAEVERGVWNRRWSELLIRIQLDQGHYVESLTTYEKAIDRYPTSLPLRALGIEVANFNAKPDLAAKNVAFIENYLNTGQLRYATSDTLVSAGRFFSKNGIDARIVLKSFYDRVLETNPTHLEALVATAQLAVEKGDFKVAAETVAKANRLDVEDARLQHLLALALRGTDASAASKAMIAARSMNPSYIPAMVTEAEIAIDREAYQDAQKVVQQILEINANAPRAHALLAVLSHLNGDYAAEEQHRKQALEHWPTNPEVDHLIGRKLSDKYRFKEGAEYQRKALTFDPKHLPATFQLAQDLLRLGDEEVGWALAEQVNEADPYNVVAYNLMTLRDSTDGFITIPIEFDPSGANAMILLRMDPSEYKVYGAAAKALLHDAAQHLCQKYDVVLKKPVLVEIFPKQSQFAIRTFGLPGGAGFLGVCFGNVVTANSPASQLETPSNWKAVLWHEFCHVVTLNKSRNRMPRWLSEGISVYEETQRDARWGQAMNVRYRAMLLGDDFTPLSQLSGAFLNPPSGLHLQFAYFESSLAVRFLIEQHGIEKLLKVLESLGDGQAINAALTEHIGPLERLDGQFTEYAKTLAMDFGNTLDFAEPPRPSPFDSPEQIKENQKQWAQQNPDNYFAAIALTDRDIADKQWQSAIDRLTTLQNAGIANGACGVLKRLSGCYRELQQTDNELAALKSWCDQSSDALDALQRLIELHQQQQDWQEVIDRGNQALAIQPFRKQLQKDLIAACRERGQMHQAIDALNSLTGLEPVDPAGLHFQLAQAYQSDEQFEQAQHQLITALLIAPRYRDAHLMLLKTQKAIATAKAEAEKAAKAAEAEKAAQAAEEVSEKDKPSDSESSDDQTQASEDSPPSSEPQVKDE